MTDDEIRVFNEQVTLAWEKIQSDSDQEFAQARERLSGKGMGRSGAMVILGIASAVDRIERQFTRKLELAVEILREPEKIECLQLEKEFAQVEEQVTPSIVDKAQGVMPGDPTDAATQATEHFARARRRFSGLHRRTLYDLRTSKEQSGKADLADARSAVQAAKGRGQNASVDQLIGIAQAAASLSAASQTHDLLGHAEAIGNRLESLRDALERLWAEIRLGGERTLTQARAVQRLTWWLASSTVGLFLATVALVLVAGYSACTERAALRMLEIQSRNMPPSEPTGPAAEVPGQTPDLTSPGTETEAENSTLSTVPSGQHPKEPLPLEN